MGYDLNILNDYIERGLLEKNPHPELPIDIYNYSRGCQYSGQWDEITLNMRGTILDRSGSVIAKPFPKFFNMEEVKKIPSEPFDVYVKMDGSLGIVFFYDNKWHVSTRGSFVSAQAVKGSEILKRYNTELLSPGYTYLFEIIYPDNRIVVDYRESERMVMLGCIDCSVDGIEPDIHIPYYVDNFDVVKKYDGVKDFNELKISTPNNSEGYVIRFESGMRMKIKGKEYVRLHKLLTEFSNISVWEILKEGDDLNKLLERVPDEFDRWIRDKVDELNSEYLNIETSALTILNDQIKGIGTDAEIAHFIKNNIDKRLQAIIFKMNKGRDYSELIWKLIRPKYEKPFWYKNNEN